MRILCPAILIALCMTSTAYAADPVCERDPSESVKRSVVGIERMFDPDEVFYDPDQGIKVRGIRGTAWLFNTKTLVTIGHIATDAKFSAEWKKVTLRWSDTKDEKWSHSLETRVRLKDIVTGVAAVEPMMTLEIEHYVPGIRIARVAPVPLMRDQPVVGIAYKNKELRFTTGRLALPEASGGNDDSVGKPPPPYLPFEMADMEKKDGVGDRYAIDHGSSGGPIFNCDGEVVAVIQAIIIFRMTIAGNSVRMTSPWGRANISGVSALPLLDQKKSSK